MTENCRNITLQRDKARREVHSSSGSRVATQAIATILVLLLSLLWPPPGSPDVFPNTMNSDQWANYGRTYDESHYSPLADINGSNVSHLGLAWWFDVPGVVLAASVPL